MAAARAGKEMDDAEFWLPSDFLSDDFFAGEERATDTDPEEEIHPKPSIMATSPQSTLSGIGSWSFSSSESPEGPSLVSSPPSTPLPAPRDEAQDLLCAAVNQVERLKLNNVISAKNQRNDMGFNPTQDLIQQQLQVARFYQLKRLQLLKQQQQFVAAVWKQQQQNRAKAAPAAVRSNGLSVFEWPPLQKQLRPSPPPQAPSRSGMTAVFLDGGRRPSSGTGVFLPRQPGAPNEPKKKQACSPVLLPARVVQALNLNLDDMRVHPRVPGCYVLDNDAVIGRSYKKKNHQGAAAAAASPELRLPQEWTY